MWKYMGQTRAVELGSILGQKFNFAIRLSHFFKPCNVIVFQVTNWCYFIWSVSMLHSPLVTTDKPNQEARLVSVSSFSGVSVSVLSRLQHKLRDFKLKQCFQRSQFYGLKIMHSICMWLCFSHISDAWSSSPWDPAADRRTCQVLYFCSNRCKINKTKFYQ